MSFPEYENYDAIGLSELVKRNEISPLEIIDEAIKRSEKLNPKLNFFTAENFDEGRRMAMNPSLPNGPFKGVPWLVKELATAWRGQPMTNSCPYMKDVIAPFDSHTVTLTKNAGFTLLGNSNSPELGWALSCESRLFGVTNNPWNLSRTPGGSSGGSAAAVAARVLPIAEASDGGGSIRVPASHCGLVGLKPSRGRVSLAPAIVDFWYGGALFFCISRSVRDTAAYLDVVGGSLPGEPYYSSKREEPYISEVAKDAGKLKIAVVCESPGGCTELEDDVSQSIKDTSMLLDQLGHFVEMRPLPFDFWKLYNTYMRIIAVQTAAFIDAMEPLVGRPPKDGDIANLYVTAIEKGRSISGVEHSNDIESMRMTCRDVASLMADFDAWLFPTIPVTAREHGWYDMSLDVEKYNNTRMGPDCAFTVPINMLGLPAVSLPLHVSGSGMPIGMQFVARDQNEALLIRLASQLEQALPWQDRKPIID